MAAREGLFVPFDGVQGASPADARLALGGLLTPNGPSTLDIRPGILYGPGTGGTEPGRVTGTGGWQYSVAAGHFIGLRSAGNGPYLFPLDGATPTPTVAAAPASGSRFDLIWVRQRDFGAGDSDSQAVVGVAQGVAGGAPTKPYADVPAGAIVLAEAEVKAGATSTSHANVTITPVARFTVPRGCAIPVRNQAERDELTKYPGLRVRRLDTGSTEECSGSPLAWGPPPDIAALTGRVTVTGTGDLNVPTSPTVSPVPGLSANVQVEAGRTYRFTAVLDVEATTVGVVGSIMTATCRAGGVDIQGSLVAKFPTVGTRLTLSRHWIYTAPTTGSIPVEIRGTRNVSGVEYLIRGGNSRLTVQG